MAILSELRQKYLSQNNHHKRKNGYCMGFDESPVAIYYRFLVHGPWGVTFLPPFIIPVVSNRKLTSQKT